MMSRSGKVMGDEAAGQGWIWRRQRGMTTTISEPEIPFEFGGQGAVATLVRYTKLVFVIFEQGYLLVLLGFSYSSSYTVSGTYKYMVALGAAQYFLRTYGRGRGGKG